MTRDVHPLAPGGAFDDDSTGDNVIRFPGERRGPRNLPHDEQAEQTIVGGVLMHPIAYHQVADAIDAKDFYHPALQAIYAAMQALDADGAPLDQLAVARKMQALGTYHVLRAYNGEAYFIELMAAVVTIENLEYHAQTVRSLAATRRILEAATAVVVRGSGADGRSRDFPEVATDLLTSAMDTATVATYRSVGKDIGDVLKSIERRYEQKSAVTGVPTGFTRFDLMTCGLQPKDLVVVAARPSMGKTSLIMNAAQNAAIEHRLPVLVFSLEMSRESLIERMVCAEARVDSTRIRTGFLEQRDWINITKATSLIADAPICIDDQSHTLVEICAKSRRWRMDREIWKGGATIGMVVVDYLQLVHGSPSKKEPNREREIADISKGLKRLAKAIKCPVVALAQLNRSCEERADKRPQLSDLRESGAIEADADVVAFIYRDERYHRDTQDRGIAEVIIGKQRNGKVGTTRLAFSEQYTRFENLAEGSDDDDDRQQEFSPPPRKGKRGKGSSGYTRPPEEKE